MVQVSNTIGNLPGAYAQIVTGWVLDTTGSWPLVFAVAAGHWLVGGTVFVAFSSTDVLL